MIAIVILGLGLVMVATMFPVAWDRARTLSEFTTQQSVLPAVETNLTSLVSVSGPAMNGAGFAGDLIFDRDYAATTTCADGTITNAHIVSISDTRVHALNLPNIRIASGAAPGGFVKEDPWRLERMPEIDGAYPASWIGPAILDDGELTPGPEFLVRSYDSGLNNALATRIAFHQRLHPPMPPRPTTGYAPASGDFATAASRDAATLKWDEQLDTRRFTWGVLHRLRSPVGPAGTCAPGGGISWDVPCDALDPCCMTRLAAEAITQSRSFDFYFVTLRRVNPTDRFARQHPGDRAEFVPDPCSFSATPKSVPQAALATEDVVLPTPWRVQIGLPATLDPRAKASGIPTEARVPASASGLSTETQFMLVSMFPTGTQFVDELTGSVYRVTSRRVSADNTSATLTLDKEVTIEDVDLSATDPRCATCLPYDPTAHPIADPEELLRTVWVYPPPVATRTSPTTVLFAGSSPVVGIDVRTLSLTPTDR